MAVDLVAFGPHPDDIEIGLGAAIARHTDAGYHVGLCDLTAGELSSNGTPEQRRVEWVCYYFINDSAPPSFVIDVSAHYERKRQALACYASQFSPPAGEAVPTRLTAATFHQLIESRDAQFGALAGVAFAEGVVV